MRTPNHAKAILGFHGTDICLSCTLTPERREFIEREDLQGKGWTFASSNEDVVHHLREEKGSLETLVSEKKARQ